MPKRALEGQSTKRRRPAKVPRNDDVGLQAEPVSDEPVTQAELVSSDAIHHDLLAAAIFKQSQTMSSNQTNSSDDTMEIMQPCVQNRRPRSFNGKTANNINSYRTLYMPPAIICIT